MLPDSGQSKWTAILAGDQRSVCLHTAQLEGGRGVGQGSLIVIYNIIFSNEIDIIEY